MKCIVISTYSYQEQIEEYINKEIEKLKENKPIVKIEQEGKTTFITCNLGAGVPESKKKVYFKEYVILPIARALVDIIEKEFGVAYANEILQTDYRYREIAIVDMVKDSLQTQSLLESIISEITENGALCLDGWVRFRLSEYKTYIVDMVSNLAYEYEAYKEYREFITLIKSFVFSQPPMTEQIHIIPGKSGRVDLYDTNIEKIDINTGHNEIQDDLVLGTLLTLAPLQIIIHKEERYSNIRLITTIKNIYEDRVDFCKGCRLCEKAGFKIELMRVLRDILTQKKL